MEESQYRKILIRQQYFARILKIILCGVAGFSEESTATLEEIDKEIEDLLRKKN